MRRQELKVGQRRGGVNGLPKKAGESSRVPKNAGVAADPAFLRMRLRRRGAGLWLGHVRRGHGVSRIKGQRQREQVAGRSRFVQGEANLAQFVQHGYVGRIFGQQVPQDWFGGFGLVLFFQCESLPDIAVVIVLIGVDDLGGDRCHLRILFQGGQRPEIAQFGLDRLGRGFERSSVVALGAVIIAFRVGEPAEAQLNK